MSNEQKQTGVEQELLLRHERYLFIQRFNPHIGDILSA